LQHKEEEEEGDGSVTAVAFIRCAVLQRSKKNTAAQRCLLRYVALQRSSTRANVACAAVVAFFVELRYSVAPQQEEEGDGSVLFFLQHKEEEEEEGDDNNAAL